MIRAAEKNIYPKKEILKKKPSKQLSQLDAGLLRGGILVPGGKCHFFHRGEKGWMSKSKLTTGGKHCIPCP